MKLFRFLFFCFLTVNFATTSAQVGVGKWRDHFPYSKTVAVCTSGDLVYTATPQAVFSYNRKDFSIERINKSNYLSDTDISTISFHEPTKTLIIGYANGNLDFIVEGQTINLPDIKSSSIIGNKRINRIYLEDQYAYLAIGFGVIQIDLQKIEVSNTYMLGPNGSQLDVLDFNSDGQYYYAVTTSGIRYASTSDPFLVNFASWSNLNNVPDEGVLFDRMCFFDNYTFLKEENLNEDILWYSENGTDVWTPMEGFNQTQIWDILISEDEFIVSRNYFTGVYDANFEEIRHYDYIQSTNVRPNMMAYDREDGVWFANDYNGLLGSTIENWHYRIQPDGPAYSNVRRMDAYNDILWIASGGVDPSWTSNYDSKGIYGMLNESWRLVPKFEGDFTGTDYMTVAINPTNTDEVFLGSWFGGLVRLLNGEMTHRYDETNSSLELANFGGTERIGVGGADFDNNGNLWFTETYSNVPLHLRSPNGTFTSFEFEPEINDNYLVSDILASQQGYIWVILPRSGGLLVFDHNDTPTQKSDDNYKLLTNEVGHGGLPTMDIYSVEEDLDGEIWVGTLQGIAVFYTPQSIFSGDDFDAQQILIEQDGNVQILLETETITAITIDGANRKWIGTQGSGVYLLSEDGLETIHHFTAENSALPSNVIEDIVINHETGEVFFATINGIMGYRSDATNFDQDMETVTVFPNPVRPEYNGLITIDGLSYKSDIRITDISGSVVYEGKSEGGRATWDGNNMQGTRVSPGVYLVFSSSQDGSATSVAKIAFVK